MAVTPAINTPITSTILTMLAGKLAIDQNLADLSDKSLARTNLGIYSTTDVDSALALKANTADVYTKAETDSVIDTAVGSIGAIVVNKGSWDASVGTFPGGGSAKNGWAYVVTVSGTVNGIDFNVGDRCLALVDNASTTIYVNNWLKLDYTDQVLSVAGLTGAITAPALRSALSLATIATSGSASDLSAGILSDARLPARLGTIGKGITDWDSALETGWYMGFGIANSPEGDTGWWMGFIQAHRIDATGYITQTVHKFVADGANNTWTYRRSMDNGVWSDWTRFFLSEAEQQALWDARYLGITAQAVDSAKLGNQDPSYYTDIAARLGYTPIDDASLATVAKTGSFNDLTNRPVQREVLTANRTYYVATTGSDANDGLTAGTAFLTIQKAVNVALALDMSIYAVTISVGAGTFNEGSGVLINGNGNARITIKGAGYTQTVISATSWAVQANYGAYVTLWEVDILSQSVGVWSRTGANIFLFGNVRFSGGPARLIGADFGGIITMNSGNLYINANSAYLFYATQSAQMGFANGANIVTSKAVSFSGAVAYSSTTAVIAFTSVQVTWNVSAGAITGPRYNANLNGVITTYGAGASWIPGSAAGTVATGGQYT